jgi:hypothetical protein
MNLGVDGSARTQELGHGEGHGLGGVVEEKGVRRYALQRARGLSSEGGRKGGGEDS